MRDLPPAPPTPEETGAASGERQRMHDLRNAINAAGLSVHAARELLRIGDVARAMDNLGRAGSALDRARALLARGADAA